MKGLFLIVILGIVIVVLGTVFYFQGQALIGPESSFMFSNPEWIVYGQEIAILGVVILGVGITLIVFKKR